MSGQKIIDGLHEAIAHALSSNLNCNLHDWETGSWGVIIGVSRCKKCGRVSGAADFPG